ncbi:MAG TPA: CRTAC1 family protein, partial [Phycisphaerales bacterium]|nr:CRTAC1 family protein [Phycisphaerales bacterium]
VIYKNNGDGTFTDMSASAGLGVRVGTGLGILCNDYTGDGRLDIFVANDGMADQLWCSNGDWTFIDVAPIRGCALDDEGKAKAGMGVSSEDFDHDGDFDIIVCNLSGESDSLFRNDGDYFTDITATKGIRTSTRHATRFGLGWVDFNNDGILDIYEANGRVQQIGTSLTDDPFAEQNYLLQGTQRGWHKIDAVHNDNIHTSRAAVFGDIDNDGGIDILVVNKDAPAYLLMNVHPDRTNSVTLRVTGPSGSDALGAVVTATLGDTQIMKSVQSAWSIMAANDPRVHIGLGEQKEISDVAVLWVDGTTTDFGTFKQGFHTLQKPK